MAVLSLVSRWALERFGGGGIAVVLGLTGLMDVHAAVITQSGLPVDAVADAAAGTILAVPVFGNTAIKGGIAILLGGRSGVAASLPLFAALLASLGGMAALWLG